MHLKDKMHLMNKSRIVKDTTEFILSNFEYFLMPTRKIDIRKCLFFPCIIKHTKVYLLFLEFLYLFYIIWIKYIFLNLLENYLLTIVCFVIKTFTYTMHNML